MGESSVETSLMVKPLTSTPVLGSGFRVLKHAGYTRRGTLGTHTRVLCVVTLGSRGRLAAAAELCRCPAPTTKRTKTDPRPCVCLLFGRLFPPGGRRWASRALVCVHLFVRQIAEINRRLGDAEAALEAVSTPEYPDGRTQLSTKQPPARRLTAAAVLDGHSGDNRCADGPRWYRRSPRP